ncbi:hypothetical protein VUR80DRAFT_4991 [Thermomyces stellatus]
MWRLARPSRWGEADASRLTLPSDIHKAAHRKIADHHLERTGVSIFEPRAPFRAHTHTHTPQHCVHRYESAGSPVATTGGAHAFSRPSPTGALHFLSSSFLCFSYSLVFAFPFSFSSLFFLFLFHFYFYFFYLFIYLFLFGFRISASRPLASRIPAVLGIATPTCLPRPQVRGASAAPGLPSITHPPSPFPCPHFLGLMRGSLGLGGNADRR